jgi:hypothetical protein
MAKRSAVEFVLRPFEGLPGEPDWVVMREVLSAASATARTTTQYGSREVVVVTVLPRAWPAVHRGDGAVLLALQQHAGSGDASRDLADLLLRALELPPSTALTSAPLPEPGPRLQDVLDLSVPFEVTLHDSFDFWTPGGTQLPDGAEEERAQYDEMIVPSRRLAAVPAAYWARMGDREYLRWAVPYDEEAFMDALARLHVRRESGLGELGRFIGAFRSCGIVIPVWDLERDAPEAELEEAAAALAARVDAALKSSDPLDALERRARAGLVARQLTLR